MTIKSFARRVLPVVFLILGFAVLLQAAETDIDLDAAKELYDSKCAACHGSKGKYLFPNKADFTSEDDLIGVYGSVSEHNTVSTCGEECILFTNTYIWDVLWGNGETDPGDDDGDEDEDDTDDGEGEANTSDNNTGCFIGSVM